WNNAISGFLLLLIIILDSVMKKWRAERRMNI
ncbi:sugar ABC transporter permease, partial [Bacillus toyonensis]